MFVAHCQHFTFFYAESKFFLYISYFNIFFYNFIFVKRFKLRFFYYTLHEPRTIDLSGIIEDSSYIVVIMQIIYLLNNHHILKIYGCFFLK